MCDKGIYFFGYNVIAEASWASGEVMVMQMAMHIAQANGNLERSKIAVQLKFFIAQMAYGCFHTTTYSNGSKFNILMTSKTCTI